jgi:hypothetical protein
MKQFALITALIILCVLALPALAQRSGRPQGGAPSSGPKPGQLSGRILAVDTQKKVAKVVLYLRVEKPDAHKFVSGIVERFGKRIDSITIGHPTLEDVFISLAR